jgi:hypothetical protein
VNPVSIDRTVESIDATLIFLFKCGSPYVFPDRLGE